MALITSALAGAAGVAHATIREQRERLPPPAACGDPIEGVWRGMVHNPRCGFWVDKTLTIRRQGDRLAGFIVSHDWIGGPADRRPPPCGARGFYEAIVRQPAEGTVAGRRVVFRATSFQVEKVLCGRFGGYNLDGLSGTLDPKRQEFQSLNNDGECAVDEPIVFRRVSCLPPPSRP